MFHLHEGWSGAIEFSLPLLYSRLIMALLFAADPQGIPVHKSHYFQQISPIFVFPFLGDTPFTSSFEVKDAFRNRILSNQQREVETPDINGILTFRLSKMKTLKMYNLLCLSHF